ncbi:MAG: FMN-binding protein [Aquificaceae bacterium]
MIRVRKWYLFVNFFVFLISLTIQAGARDFKTPERAIKDVFPDVQIEIKNLILSEEQKERVEKLSGTKMDSRLVSWYVAKREGKILGYAYIDIHTVRTHQETVLYVINPSGGIEVIEVLSFNEPLEYMPDENWLKLFKGRVLAGENLILRRDIPNISGATLTARAITNNTRKVLALWNVLFGGKR